MKRAYVSMICTGDGYLPGVETLGRSLDATGSEVPRLLLVTPDVSEKARDQLSSQGWGIREVQPIANPKTDGEVLYERFGNVFTKLRAWQLEDVEKAVFLDADTVVLKNVDHLFERPEIAAAPDFFLPDRFNSGVMVLEPSQKTFAAMLEKLAQSGSYDGGDQGFLNDFFGSWWGMSVEHRLPMAYNTHHFIFQFLLSHDSLKKQLEDEIKIVHYTLQKPWKDAMVSGGSELWWKLYYSLHPDESRPWKERLHALQDWTFKHMIGLIGA